jgi:hypothetical protein
MSRTPRINSSRARAENFVEERRERVNNISIYQ